MSKNHIYSEEIRKYEGKVIDFVVESGKNKRSSDIESHILSYFFCHKRLTQKEIQQLSSLYRDKKISRGSISNFLKKYERYGVISKNDKDQPYTYSIKNLGNKTLIRTGFEAGLKELDKWIEFIETRRIVLKEMRSNQENTYLHSILLIRLSEIRDFFQFHKSLMKNFFREKSKFQEKLEINISNKLIDNFKKKSLEQIEKELIKFIETNPLFMMEEIKYLPIIAYLITRKKLTQSELQKLTGLSSGLISEGLNYLSEKEYIEMEKKKGIRKRFYSIPSIGYSNYLKQLNRFEKILSLKTKIEEVYQEMKKGKEKLKDLKGYVIIFNWVKETLRIYSMVEKGINLFQKALSHFINTK